MTAARRPKHAKAVAGAWEPIGSRMHFDVCCDCGLVHKSQFKVLIVATTGGRTSARLFQRVWRDERATAAKRREKRKRGEL